MVHFLWEGKRFFSISLPTWGKGKSFFFNSLGKGRDSLPISLFNDHSEIFKSTLSFLKRIENHDVIFNVLFVIAIILTNNEKAFEKNSLKFIYNFIVTLQQKNEFVKFCRDKLVKTTQRKNDRFFKSMYFLNENEFLKHHDKIYMFDETFIQTIFSTRYRDDKLIKHLKINKTVKLFVCKYYRKNIIKYVRSYVKICNICQKTKVFRHRFYNELMLLL